jgi:CRP/FNR family transcriptional regulator
MTLAYNFRIIEDCTKCAFREHRLFCDLPGNALTKLQDIKATAVYPKGALLCLEGQAPRGIFVLCTGRAKLTTTSAEGKSIILRIAEPGEVLGLTAVFSNTPYEATVETLEPSQANFISQTDFVHFMKDYPDVGMKVAQQLTHNCRCAYGEIRSIGLSNSRNAYTGRDRAVCRHVARDCLPCSERLPQKRMAADQRCDLDNP